MTERVWYFAYGSNMQPATFAGRRGIAPSRALPARAPGWRLTFDKTPLVPIGESFANLMPEPDAETFGVLYEIRREDLAHIDLTEGVLIGNYERREIEIIPLAAGRPTCAFTLLSNKRSPDLRPSEYYMALLIEGAEVQGLPPEWIGMLRAVPTCASSPDTMAGRSLLNVGLASLRQRKS
jgi:cation transport regulator ChaC